MTILVTGIVLLSSVSSFAQTTASNVICNGCVQTTDIATGTIRNEDISSSSTYAIDPSKISGTAWTGSNDGSGSTLDADKLDGVDSTSFLQSGQNATLGNVTLTDDTGTTTGTITNSTATTTITSNSGMTITAASDICIGTCP